MAAALRFAARTICVVVPALARRPPQASLTAAKQLAARTSHAGRGWLRRPFSFSSSSQSPATLLGNSKGAGPSSTASGELLRAVIGPALAGMAAVLLVSSPVYVSTIRRAAKRRAADRQHRDWLRDRVGLTSI